MDDKDKGHYKVRDVSRFLLTSMYKRKDRVTRTPGVSLLVGKLENPPHEEKVISALFDTDRFTERAAAQWWEDNGHRFEDARSLAEKKVHQECQPRIANCIDSPPLVLCWSACHSILFPQSVICARHIFSPATVMMYGSCWTQGRIFKEVNMLRSELAEKIQRCTDSKHQ